VKASSKPEIRAADSRTTDARVLPAWLRADGDGALVLAHLQPGARRTALVGTHGGRLKIAVQAPPSEGRANDALLAWLAERLGVPRRRLKITAGLRSRDKTVRVDGCDAQRVHGCLAPE
jgi:hypothetical protein